MKNNFFSAKTVSLVLMMLMIATYLPAVGAKNSQTTQLQKGEVNTDVQALLVSSQHGLASAASTKQIDTSTTGWNELSLNDAYDDQLDQQQTEHEYNYDPFGIPYYGYVIPSDFLWAQSFIPTLPILTRVKIKLMISDDPVPDYDVLVSVRADLDGKNLALVTLSADDICEYEGDMTEINFDDLVVTPGQSYYIVCQVPDQPDDIPPGYVWGFGEETSYVAGQPYMKHSWGSWGPVSGFDFMFETYGKVDTCDQQQLEHTYVSFDPLGLPYWGFVIPDDLELTQSFIPTQSTLTRIKVHLFTGNNPTFDLIITIKDSENNVVATAVITADQVPNYDSGILTEVDITDITLNPGETYYIGAICPDFEGSLYDSFPYYAWSFGEETSYLDGEANVGLIEDTDFVFVTYGV